MKILIGWTDLPGLSYHTKSVLLRNGLLIFVKSLIDLAQYLFGLKGNYLA